MKVFCDFNSTIHGVRIQAFSKCKRGVHSQPYTVIPRLTSDLLTNFSANENFFAVFRTRLTNMDSANECFSGCAR